MITIKALEDLNREFMSEHNSNNLIPALLKTDLRALHEGMEYPEQSPGDIKPSSSSRKLKPFTTILDILFFVLVFAALVGAVIFINTGEVKPIFGFSYYTVLTSSMQDEIPKGSLIITQRTDPKTLKIGDNITFARNNGIPVTHKIVEIYGNYEGTSAIGFKTKGINNPLADDWIVLEDEILGKVVYVSPFLGERLEGIINESGIAFIVFGVCAISYIVLRFVPYKKGKRS